VADEYQTILSQIGVEISYEKSFIGKPNSGVFEFCKRNAYNQNEISGVS
jgi:hypothetical protein